MPGAGKCQSIPMFTDDCRFDAQSPESLKQSLIDLKLLDAVPALKTTYTDVFLPQQRSSGPNDSH